MHDNITRTGASEDAPLGDAVQVTCPYCRSTDTAMFSLFGQQLLTVQYYCNTCHTPFEYVKDDAVLRRAGGAHDTAPTVGHHTDK